MRFGMVLALSLLLVLAPSVLLGATIHVPGDQPTIQAGIDAAVAGDTVLVAAGTFTGDGNRDIIWEGKDLVLRSEAGADLTMIDAEVAFDWSLQCMFDNPHRILFLGNGVGTSSSIEGFTFTRGIVNDKGGAAHFLSASPMVRECVFLDDVACSGGGALFLEGFSFPSIVNCTFVHCRGGLGGVGGAIASDVESAPVIVSCVFEENEIGDWLSPDPPPIWGGAVSAWGATITDCVFRQNVSQTFAGALTVAGGSVVTDCYFESNEALARAGGAVICGEGDRVEDCTFVGNSSSGWGHASGCGGALACSGACIITGCYFLQNTSNLGGGISCGGPALIEDCVFAENAAPFVWGIDTGGGGISVGSGGNPRIVSCTFWGNTAESGGGLRARYGNATLENCIIANSTEGGGVQCQSGSIVTLSCCDVFGNAGGDWANCIAGQDTINGNFSGDPLFCDAPDGDFSLSSKSPCVIPQLDPACGEYIGVWGVGCGTARVAEGRTVIATWGLIKSILRIPGE